MRYTVHSALRVARLKHTISTRLYTNLILYIFLRIYLEEYQRLYSNIGHYKNIFQNSEFLRLKNVVKKFESYEFGKITSFGKFLKYAKHFWFQKVPIRRSRKRPMIGPNIKPLDDKRLTSSDPWMCSWTEKLERSFQLHACPSQARRTAYFDISS